MSMDQLPSSSQPVKKRNRTGVGAKKRKIEKARIRANERWDREHQARLEAWKNSFRTDIIINTTLNLQNVEQDENYCGITPQDRPNFDIELENFEDKSLIGLPSTMSLVPLAANSPSSFTPQFCAPSTGYSNEFSVPCVLLDSSETHSLNYYTSIEELSNDVVKSGTAASKVKETSVDHEFVEYGEVATISIKASHFSSYITSLKFNGDSLIIYSPNENGIYGLDDPHCVRMTPFHSFDQCGEKLLLITDNAGYLRKYHFIKSIAIILPMYLSIIRTGQPPAEDSHFASLLAMGKHKVTQYIGFVT